MGYESRLYRPFRSAEMRQGPLRSVPTSVTSLDGYRARLVAGDFHVTSLELVGGRPVEIRVQLEHLRSLRRYAVAVVVEKVANDRRALILVRLDAYVALAAVTSGDLDVPAAVAAARSLVAGLS